MESNEVIAKVDQRMALVDGLETQVGVSRATVANLPSSIGAESTSNPDNGKVAAASTGRRGRPRNS